MPAVRDGEYQFLHGSLRCNGSTGVFGLPIDRLVGLGLECSETALEIQQWCLARTLDSDSARRRSWEPVDQQFEPEAQAFVPASPQAGSQHLVRLSKVDEAEQTVARPVLELAKYHSSDQPDSQAVRIDFGSPPVLMRRCGHVWSIGLSALVSVLVLLDFQTLPWLSSLRKVSHDKVKLEQPSENVLPWMPRRAPLPYEDSLLVEQS